MIRLTREIVYLRPFEKNWNRLGLTDAGLSELESAVLKNPQSGDVIQGAGGLRKLRFEQLYFINVYAKNERDNIDEASKKTYKQLISETEEILKGR